MDTEHNLAEVMESFLHHHPTLLATDFVPARLARWAWDEQVFSFFHAGQDHYPCFQFDAGQNPLPIMQKLLPILTTHFTNWQIALWFTSQNPLLDNRKPADLLACEPDAVCQAARMAPSSK